MTPLVYSVTEAAHALKVNRATLGRLIAAGELQVVRLGRRVLIRHEHLVALLDARTGTGVPGDLAAIGRKGGAASAKVRWGHP